jgi:hypothetical protein
MILGTRIHCPIPCKQHKCAGLGLDEEAGQGPLSGEEITTAACYATKPFGIASIQTCLVG